MFGETSYESFTHRCYDNHSSAVRSQVARSSDSLIAYVFSLHWNAHASSLLSRIFIILLTGVGWGEINEEDVPDP